MRVRTTRTLAVRRPAAARAVPTLPFRQRHGMRRHHALLAAQLRHTLAQLVHPPIHLADARVDGGQYTCAATYAKTSLRKRRERRDRHHRQVGAVRDTLDHTHNNAQTRERTGATSEGDGIE